jgi:hypothetical protein
VQHLHRPQKISAAAANGVKLRRELAAALFQRRLH